MLVVRVCSVPAPGGSCDRGPVGVVERGSGAAGAGVVLGALLGPETTGPLFFVWSWSRRGRLAGVARGRGGGVVVRGVWCFGCSRRPAPEASPGSGPVLLRGGWGGFLGVGSGWCGVCGLLFENCIVDASILKTPHRARPVRGVGVLSPGEGRWCGTFS